MKPTYIYLTLIGIILILLFWNVENKQASEDYRIEKEQAKKRLKVVRDSVVKVIQRKDIELLKAMRESAEADLLARDAVADAQRYKQKYDKIVFRPTRNDRERDSLLRAVLQH